MARERQLSDTELYAGFLYAHVDWPIADDAYNTNRGGLAWIARDNCNCLCYQGRHVHVEAEAGSVRLIGCYSFMHEGVD